MRPIDIDALLVALDSAGVVACEIDGVGNVQAVTDNIQNFLGHTPDAVIGKPLRSYACAEDGATIDQAFHRLAHGEPANISCGVRLMHRSGHDVHVELRANHLPGPEGGPAVATLRLISADERVRCRSEYTAESAEILLRSVADHAMYLLDRNGVVQSWNTGAERIKGYTAEEIVGQHYRIFFTDDDVRTGVPQRALTQALTLGKYEAQGWRVRKDGSRFWANVVLEAVHDDMGTVVGFAKITRDATRIREIEREREELTLRHRLATEAGRVGVFDWEIGAESISCDRSMHQLFGFDTARVIDRFSDWMSAVHPDDRSRITRDIELAITRQADLDSEFRIFCPSGAMRFLHARGALFRAAPENAQRMLGTVWDVSAIRLSADRDRATNAQLAEKNRLMAMAEAMAKVAHWRLDLTTNELMWSDEIYRIFGLPKTYTPQLDRAIELYHPEDRPLVRDCVESAINAGTPFSFDARIIYSDGSYRYVICHGQAEQSASGLITGVFGVFQDVTLSEESARERERLISRLTLATEAGRVGIWEWDIASGNLVWDAMMYQLYGLDKTDHSPSFATWSGALHPDDREPTLERISAAAADGSVWSGEFRATWPNGEIRMIRAMARVVCSDDGRPETMIGTNWDVTELRRLTENLRIAAEHDRQTALVLHEKNRLMAMAEEMAHVGHWRLDLATGESYCSEEILRAHGLPSTHRLDLKAALAAYHPDDRDAVAGIVERAVASGADYSYEARIIRSDGAIRHVLSRGQCERSQAGNVVAIFGVFQDITSLKDSERERLRLLERVTLAAKSGKIGIWERDLRTDELIWDATMFKLYGIPPQSTSPSAELWKTLVHPLDVERVTSAAKRYTGSEPLEIEYRIVWPTGEVRHVRSQGTILRDDTGDPVRIVGTFWDITEIRSLTEQLGREKDAAEAANIAKSDFLANMSHEIRTPMNGVIGLTSLLLDGEVTPEQRAQLTLLADSGRSLLAIINDILDLSKVEAGKMELESLVMSVGGLVDGALSIVRSEASAKGLALTATLATDIPTWVTGDPTRLRQILLNLLTNAIKFTDRGRVELSVRRIDRTSDLIKFEIADTGIGIAPDRQHLLFEKFSQADRTIARAYGGTGLGLALSRRLTEAMSGTMGFSSVPGSGSTFWFTARLPASDAPRATSATRTASAAPPLRILVVDDNATNLVVVKGMLSQDGHHVEVAHDGAEGLAAVQASRYDLVFMDMHMPVLDGLAATRRIRALALPMSRVPIIALSANVMSTEIERCKEAGMDDHVAKPIDRIRLQRIVADWSQSEWKARATGVAPQPPIFDLQPLIDALGDDAASLESVLDDAIASMRVQVERIAHGIRDEDTASVIAAAHHLTGTFRELRALDLANLASQIEHTPAAEFWTSAVASLGELESMTAALTASIETSKRDFVLR